MIAELFVTQTHLALDDPEGPYTCGSPQEVADWRGTHITSVSTRPADETRPRRHVIDLDDESAVVVVIDGRASDSARIGELGSLNAPGQWAPESEAWVLVGGQPGAERFVEVLTHVMAKAPHADEIVSNPRDVAAAECANTMIEARSGRHGAEARRAAHAVWIQAERHRERKFGVGPAAEEMEDSECLTS